MRTIDDDKRIHESFLAQVTAGLSNLDDQSVLDTVRNILENLPNSSYNRNHKLVISNGVKCLTKFSRLCNSKDVLLLKNIFKNLEKGNKTLLQYIEEEAKGVADCILCLIKNNKDVDTLNLFLNHRDADITKKAFQFLLKNPDYLAEKDKEIEKFLMNRCDRKRLYAIAYFSKRYDKSKIEKLIDSCHKHPKGYYFDVICWLDRLAYAPKELKNYYKSELSKNLEKA